MTAVAPRAFVVLTGALWVLGGCANAAGVVPTRPLPAREPSAAMLGVESRARSPIRHVVFIIQENRSFDNLFQGYPGADTQSWGYNSRGEKIMLAPIGLEAPYDIAHFSYSFLRAYDRGKMDGFDLEGVYGRSMPFPQYGYVPHAETKVYFQMAHRYVLADRMFTSNFDASFASHQYAIAGQAHYAVDLPSLDWGCDGGPQDVIRTWTRERRYGPKEGVCFDYPTIGDELDAAGLTWRFYAFHAQYDWEPYQAVRHIRYGGDWNNVQEDAQFFSDVESGHLATVSWVTPECKMSDHAGCESNKGPRWVASLVNAVGRSKFWASTAIFIIWDEWGGWYDHVPPPRVDYDGLGFRVPLLIVSPYAKENYVSHVQYEHGSVLRFIEDNFGLGRLAASDARANDPAADCFDFSRGPRAFSPLDSGEDRPDVGAGMPDIRPPDGE